MTKKPSVEITASEGRPIIRVPWCKEADIASSAGVHIIFEHPEHPILVTLPLLELPKGFAGRKQRTLALMGAAYRLLEASGEKAVGYGKHEPLNAGFLLED